MAIAASRVTASTTAVALNTATPGGSTIYVKNTSANAADLGTAAVAANAGFDLAAGVTATIQLAPGEVLYAIRSAAADATIAVLRTGA